MFSTYLASLKQFPNNEQKNILTNHFISISLNDFFQLRDVSSNELSSTLLCAFVDIMRLYAPEIPYEPQTMDYYLSYLVKWLLCYEPSDGNVTTALEIKFEYIIERLAKSNLLSVIVGTQLESKIPEIIKKIISIQKEKNYLTDSEIFGNFILIITGLLEEMYDTPFVVLNELLEKLNKKKYKEEYELCKGILTKMKNLLSAPINELIVSKKKIKLQGEDFCIMIKELSKISPEFLMKFFLNVPEKKLNEEICGAKYIDILLKIFSSEGSLKLIQNYKNLLFAVFDKLTAKRTTLELKNKIFKSLVKFLEKNKIKKDDNIFFVFIEKIKTYLKEIKNEGNAINILETTKRIHKWRLVNTIIISLLSSGYSSVYQTTTKFVFEYLTEGIFQKFNLFDFNSVDKLKILIKASISFNYLLNLLTEEPSVSEVFNKCLIEALGNKNYDADLITLTILFFMTLQTQTSNAQFNEVLGKLYFGKNIEEKNKLSFYEDVETIESLNKFFSSYINCVDEESNKNSVILLNAMLYVMSYYIKYLSFSYSSEEVNPHLENVYMIIENVKLVIENKIKSKETIIAMMILLKQLINLDADNRVKNSIQDVILDEVANFIFSYNEISPKSFAIIFYEQSEVFSQKKLEGDAVKEELKLPVNFYQKLRDNSLDNPIKFINEVLKHDKTGKFNSVLFSDDILSYVLMELKESNLIQTTEAQNEMRKDPESNDAKRKMIHHVEMYHEVLKYQFYHLIRVAKLQVNFREEVDKYIKFILNSIYLFFTEEYNNYVELQKEKNQDDEEEEESKRKSKEKNKKKSKPQKSKPSTKEKLEVLKNPYKIYTQIQLICIAKYINLLLKFCENQIQIKSSHQVKIVNLLLCKEKFIRNHFIQKLYKKIIKRNTSLTCFLNIIPMLTISFADEDKKLSNLAYAIVGSFIDILLNKLKSKEDITSNSCYKYIPEVYLSYIIVYFVFNSNLNIFFQRDPKKSFFSEIINNFFKLIKKKNNNNIDSDFLLRLVNIIKNEDIKDKKVMKKIFSKGIFLKIEEYELEDIDYEKVKNGVCEFVRGIISNYNCDFTYGNIKPKIPVIFTNNSENFPKLDEGNTTKTFILDTNKIQLTASVIKGKRKALQLTTKDNVNNMPEIEGEGNNSKRESYSKRK